MNDSTGAADSNDNEAVIIAHLQAHPDFFTAHPELLEKLYIPHARGAAVSLVEKQLDLLRDKNRRLQHQLDELLDIARDNDKLFQRLHQLTLAMLDADDLETALASLADTLYQCFDADFVAVRIFLDRPDAPLSDVFLAPLGINPFGAMLAQQKPLFGRLNIEQGKLLFGADADQVASSAVVPLLRGDWQGLLGIGSRDEQRFHP
ncbi:DUF484 family protein, partial [Methylogaea oryzae]